MSKLFTAIGKVARKFLPPFLVGHEKWVGGAVGYGLTYVAGHYGLHMSPGDIALASATVASGIVYAAKNTVKA